MNGVGRPKSAQRGIMDMDSALRAAAARGTEMGSVEIDDNGLMASVTAEYEEVAAVIESIDGYVSQLTKIPLR